MPNGLHRAMQRICKLPLLMPSNRQEYPQWHAYFKEVYDEPVSRWLNLNEFTWFYWSVPIQNLSLHFGSESFGTSCFAWTGSYRGHPEYILGDLGFFVYRRKASTNYLQKRRLEVIRTCKPLTLFGNTVPPDMSLGTVWFYHAIGSGVFLDVDSISASGMFTVAKDRRALTKECNLTSFKFDVDWEFLVKNDISILAITEAFGWMMVPRTEVILRYDPHLPGCCNYPGFSKGFLNHRPCNCSNTSGFIGCRSGRRQQ